jgi:hypothetical protein
MMPVAIIGRTSTSALLVIPTFYDSVEIRREKFGRLISRLRGKGSRASEVISAKYVPSRWITRRQPRPPSPST